MSPLLLAIVPFVLAAVLWAVLDLERFVMIVVLGSMVYPATIVKPAGVNVATVDILLLVALVAWLMNNALRNAPDPIVRGNRLLYAGVLFAALQWVSLLWSVDPGKTFSFGIQSVELFVVLPLVFASLPRGLGTIEQGMRVLLILTAVMALALVATYIGHPARARELGTYLPGLNKNAAGSFQAVGIVLAFTFLLRARAVRGWIVVCLLLDVAGLVAAASRGAMLGAAAGVLLVSLLRGRGRIASLALLATLGAMYLAVIAPAEAAKTTQSGSYSSAAVRLTFWKAAVRKIEQRPFLGTGGGTYDDVRDGQTDPNNTFLLTWAEDGLPGMLALGFLFTTFGVLVVRIRRLQDDQATVLATAAAGVSVALLTHFQVDVSWARGAASLALSAMGLLIAIERLAVRPPPPAAIRPADEPATEIPRLVLTGA